MLCWASYWENKGVGRASLCPSLHKQMQTRPQGLEMSSETEANIGLDALSPGASPRPPGGGEDSARGCLLQKLSLFLLVWLCLFAQEVQRQSPGLPLLFRPWLMIHMGQYKDLFLFRFIQTFVNLLIYFPFSPVLTPISPAPTVRNNSIRVSFCLCISSYSVGMLADMHAFLFLQVAWFLYPILFLTLSPCTTLLM